MKKFIAQYHWFIFACIILVGIVLRFYLLGQNPPSINWDETSTGYNAYSILKTGKDEYGNFLPLSIRSFDDYKPPLYTYLDIPFVAVFGLTELAVRLPSAILGTLSIVVIYFLILELFTSENEDRPFVASYKEEIALAGALLFAISPWSLQFSRAAYEGNIGLFFLMGGMLFFLKGFKKNLNFILSTVFFGISLYAYHSFRLVTPLLLIAALIIFYKKLLKVKKIVILSAAILFLLALPVFFNLFFSANGTGSRLGMVALSSDLPNFNHSIADLSYDQAHHDLIGEVIHNRRIVYALAVIQGYLDHYNPDFLFLHGDGGRQHHAVDMGMLYLFELPFILLGFIVLVKKINKKIAFLFVFMVLAPLPSAITTGTPHPVRAISMLPVFVILSAIGLVFLLVSVGKIKNLILKYVLFATVLLVIACNIVYYLHQYYVHTPLEYGDFWQYGYKEALAYAKENESQYDHIVVTYKYDQPYIYYLFYNAIDPSLYQKNWDFTGNGVMPRFERKIGKYDFKNINWGTDSQLKNTLFIGAPDEIPNDRTMKRIYFLNGQEAFRIAKS